MAKFTRPSKLLWLDLEMTGLDPENDRIIEVGAIVTDFEFNELGSFEAIIKQPDEALNRMKQAPWYDWKSGQREVVGTVYDMASQNGLVEKVHQGRDESEVENELSKLVEQHFDQKVVLAGNSIHQDRRFIRRWWPKLEEKLHYRMLDVTSFKIYLQGSRAVEFNKADSHRALEDIRGSIEELQYYLKLLSE